MTHLLLKYNILKGSLFYLCIIGLAIYALGCQLTESVYLQFSGFLKPNVLLCLYDKDG